MTPAEAIDPLIQADYGGFNPRFLGISLFYDSSVNYEAVTSYLIDEDGPEVGGLHGITLRSVLDHEARHYVDFLLSTYSAATFRLRLQAMVNGIQAISLVSEMEGSVLPVPLTRWALCGRNEREAFEREWSELFGREMPAIPMPRVTREQLWAHPHARVESMNDRSREERFAAFVEAAAGAYVAIDDLTEGFGADDDAPYLRPVYIHEVSALCTQIAAIHYGQGLEEANAFAKFLVESDLPQAAMWRLVLSVATTLEFLWSGNENPLAAVRRMLAVAVWAMTGDFVADQRAACPARRFRALAAGLFEDTENRSWSGDIDDQESLERMWDYWDRRLGFTPWRRGLSSQIASGERALEQYRVFADNEPAAGGLALSAIEVAVRYQRKLVETMLGDPRVLAVPERHVRAPREQIPHPDTRLEFRGFATKTLSERAIPLNRFTQDGEVYASGAAFSSGGPERHDELRRKLQIEEAIEWCDLVFSRLSVSAHTALSARTSLERITGKRILQLI